MKKIENTVIGLILIIIGVIIGLNAFHITNIDLFFDGWWTLFIIVPCFFGLFKDQDKTGNIIGLIVGIYLLLYCQVIALLSRFNKFSICMEISGSCYLCINRIENDF